MYIQENVGKSPFPNSKINQSSFCLNTSSRGVIEHKDYGLVYIWGLKSQFSMFLVQFTLIEIKGKSANVAK